MSQLPQGFVPASSVKLEDFTAKDVLLKRKHNLVKNLLVALANMQVREGSPAGLFVGDLNSILQIPATDSGSSSGTGISWEGEYNNTTAYLAGDFVQVSPASTFATTNSTPGPSLPGIYLCVVDSPTSTDYPKNPLQTGGMNTFWLWISTWPSLVQFCNATTGTPSVYIVDAQPQPAS